MSTVISNTSLKSGKQYFLSLALIIICCAAVTQSFAQSARYNLSGLQSKGQLIAENRTVTTLKSAKAVRLSAAEGSGVAWLKEVNFTEGTIEVDVRGKDIKQESFIGIAFHGVSKDSTEAVYFRPFNFLATDSAQRTHMVQYVFDKHFGWERLRTEHPGQYESPLLAQINPNSWFHLKLTVKGKSIKVYTNHSAKPCLVVNSLNQNKSGKLGLWVGNTSGGDFANLTITPN
jgi:hypothetical protein